MKLKIKKGDTVKVITGASKDKEAVRKVLEVYPKENKALGVGRRLNENGKLVRYSKKSGEEIK